MQGAFHGKWPITDRVFHTWWPSAATYLTLCVGHLGSPSVWPYLVPQVLHCWSHWAVRFLSDVVERPSAAPTTLLSHTGTRIHISGKRQSSVCRFLHILAAILHFNTKVNIAGWHSRWGSQSMMGTKWAAITCVVCNAPVIAKTTEVRDENLYSPVNDIPPLRCWCRGLVLKHSLYSGTACALTITACTVSRCYCCFCLTGGPGARSGDSGRRIAWLWPCAVQ